MNWYIINSQYFKQNCQRWAIPGKIQTGGLKIYFSENTLGTFSLSLYPKIFQRKQAFNPGNSAKFCDTPCKFQVQKPRATEIT